jgi:hypothetical protein
MAPIVHLAGDPGARRLASFAETEHPRQIRERIFQVSGLMKPVHGTRFISRWLLAYRP